MAVLASFLLLLVSFTASQTVLKPVKNGTEIAIIMIQGADIPSTAYIPPMQVLQQITNYSLWVGLPSWPKDPDPLNIDEKIQAILTQMRLAGMTTKTIFYAGHSLGGVVVSGWVFNNSAQVAGQILMGSFLTRSYRGNVSDYTENTYPSHTLTIAGELDGVARVTRVGMETYWHYVYHAQNPSTAIYNWPVVVLMGQTHMQFASGDIPRNVLDNDLVPEVTYQEAYKATATTISNFFLAQVDKNTAPITQQVQATGVWLQPLINAFTLEGFAHFKPPCNQDPTINVPLPNCTTGSQFVQTAQQSMAGLNDTTVNNTDNFHPVAQTDPVHLSSIENNCTLNQTTCILNTITVTQNVYDDDDSADTGASHTSAKEMECKLSSRQKIWIYRGLPTPPLNQTDTLTNCADINKLSYQWALANVGNANTLSRFNSLGLPMVMGQDIDLADAGPAWVDTPIVYQTIYDQNNIPIYLQVRSVALITDIDNIIPPARGFHYCKVLSPARSLEWIYVDGLRAFDSIKNQTKTL